MSLDCLHAAQCKAWTQRLPTQQILVLHVAGLFGTGMVQHGTQECRPGVAAALPPSQNLAAALHDELETVSWFRLVLAEEGQWPVALQLLEQLSVRNS